MASRTRNGITAGAATVLAVAIGALTNLVTSRWSWALGAALLVLIVAAVGLAVHDAVGGSPAPSPTPLPPTATPPSRTIHVRGNGAYVERGDVVHGDKFTGDKTVHNYEPPPSSP